MKRSIVLILLTFAGLASLSTPPGLANERVNRDLVRIGMVQTLFTDVPPALVNFLVPPFSSLMKDFTGLNGKILTGGNPFDVAQKLAVDQLDLAVFHGVEFGWAQQKYPELRPLMIAINRTRHLQAHLVVRADDPAEKYADLKGKVLGIPFRAKEHCRMFVDKNCVGCAMCDPKSFFGQIVKPAHNEAALDDVVNGKIGAAVVDNVSLAAYADIKPGCYKRLRVLKDSEVFPAGVVAYRQGALSEEMLNKFRAGMISANKSERGRDLMTLWKISAFESVPEDYQQVLTDIIRAYPAPIVAATVSRPGESK